MHLIELFLPIYDGKGKKIPKALFEKTSDELIKKFGGLTAYFRSPIKGYWKTEHETIVDELLIFEIIEDCLSVSWWKEYRFVLEKRFKQNKLMMRTYPIQLL